MEEVMNLTVGQICGGLAGIVVLLSIFIEITPIKINPMSAFLSWIGRKTSGDVLKRLDDMEGQFTDLSKKVDRIEYSNDKRNAISCRVRILKFGDECRTHVKHSKESFDQILEDIDVYERYCDVHPEFRNNRTVLSTQFIKGAYQKCVEDNDFL